ncbi:MAG: hypothetical protein A2099_04845 [Planctomycetes bacterium GWF2_39_10]|nr:MAG: hypothetical protein A2099_04845 [Planctomycetes bacterium GWF2_39_10]
MRNIETFRTFDFDTTLIRQNIVNRIDVLAKEASKTIYYEAEIKNLLAFYKDEHIYLKKVEYLNNKFYFTFKKFDYPYFKFEVKHLTREQTISFVTQASYLWGMINNLYDDRWNYPLDKFYNYVENEKMGFIDISIKYRKFIKNKQNLVLIFNSVNYRTINSRIFGVIDFELEKYCTGKLKFFIDL